ACVLDHLIAGVVDVVAVVADAALQLVGARTAIEDVVAAAAEEVVVRIAADDGVVIGAADGALDADQPCSADTQIAAAARGAGAEVDRHRAAGVAVVIDRIDAVAAVDQAVAHGPDAADRVRGPAGGHVEVVVSAEADHGVVAA